MISIARKIQHFAVATALCIASVSTASAQESSFPTKPVRVVLPFAPGTSLDIIMRIVTPKLADKWGQPVIIENRVGAAGAIGASAVARSAPDGHTIFYTANSIMVANPHVYKKLQYSPTNDFKPTSLVVNLGYVLMARPGFPAKNLAELIELAKQNPGKYTYASAGVGSGNHIAMELLKSLTGIDMLHIPVTGAGTTPLLSGDVDLTLNPYTSAIPLLGTTGLTALGVTLEQRLPSISEVPSIGEVVPGYLADAWHGLFVPAGVPDVVVAKISADVAAVLKDPEVNKKLSALELDVVGSTPEAFAKKFAEDYEKWGRIVKKTNITID